MSSLPCDHIFCNDCLRNLGLEKSCIVCPTCRQECETEDFQPVPFSAREQWDKLLLVVKDFASLDNKRGGVDTTDEEVEEDLANNFIQDAEGWAQNLFCNTGFNFFSARRRKLNFGTWSRMRRMTGGRLVVLLSVRDLILCT